MDTCSEKKVDVSDLSFAENSVFCEKSFNRADVPGFSDINLFVPVSFLIKLNKECFEYLSETKRNKLSFLLI